MSAWEKSDGETPMSQRFALVTGGSSGVGGEACRRLAADGWQVVAHRGRADGDLATAQGVDALIERARTEVGAVGLSLLLHCAGHFEADVECDWEAAAAMFAVHAQAFHRLVIGLRPYLAAARGTVALVSSCSARKATPDQALYGASKAAAEAVVANLGYWLGRDGIRVVGLRPSLIRTRMSASALADSDLAALFVRQSPLGRIAEARDIVDAMLTLAAPQAAWITGTTVWADGAAARGWGNEFES
jgi:NAD(P)-dependent dehydrogenase (short-subunit alcohol dehydrogenase family)